MDAKIIEVLGALLPLIPTVGVWAFVVNRLIELAKAQGFVKPDTAHLWNASLNAFFYLVMFFASEAGYGTVATDFAKKVEEAWPLISAVVSLVVLVVANTGLTKLLHEWLKTLKSKG